VDAEAGVDPVNEEQERAAVVDEATAWIGTPWHHEARVKGHGVDCGQLLAAVFEACGLVPRVEVEPYPQDWALHRGEERFLKTVESYARRVDRPALPGDIVLFRYGRCISHAGIVAAWPSIVHAYLCTRSVTLDDVLKNADLGRRLVGVWTLNHWR
jgi:cell wall-associated NlpC family hydrolase